MGTPKPKCEACDSVRRDELDLALTRGMAITLVAQAYSLPVETVVWHVERHLRGLPKRVSTDPRDLLDDLQWAKTRAENVLNVAEKAEKWAVALSAIREFRECVFALAKLTHAEQALDPTAYMPLFAEIKSKILAAVEDHPEIRDRLVKALSFQDEGKKND